MSYESLKVAIISIQWFAALLCTLPGCTPEHLAVPFGYL